MLSQKKMTNQEMYEDACICKYRNNKTLTHDRLLRHGMQGLFRNCNIFSNKLLLRVNQRKRNKTDCKITRYLSISTLFKSIFFMCWKYCHTNKSLSADAKKKNSYMEISNLYSIRCSRRLIGIPYNIYVLVRILDFAFSVDSTIAYLYGYISFSLQMLSHLCLSFRLYLSLSNNIEIFQS